jgi:hypothetical protein
MKNENVVRLGDVHRWKGELTASAIEAILDGPVAPHRFLDVDRVRSAAFELPSDAKLGREIYVGAINGFEETPWQMIVDIDCIDMDRSDSGLLTTTYGTTVTTLDRKGYADFIAGNFDLIENGAEFTNRFTIPNLRESWAACEAEGIPGPFIQKCHFIDMRKGSRLVLKRRGSPIGYYHLLNNRGDEPALITGMSLISFDEERVGSTQPSWKVEIICHYWQEGYDQPFVTGIENLRPLPVRAPQALPMQKVG